LAEHVKENAVAPVTMDPLEWLRKQLEIADVDPLRELVQRVAEALMSADANAVCGAGDGERSPDRVNVRNGDRTRPWDTRVGTIDLAVPKLRSGSHIPGWRWNLGGGPSVLWSRSSPRPTSPACRPPGGGPGAGAGGAAVEQVPGIGARSLVGRAGGRVPRPALDAGPYPYVWVDALAIRCRDDHRIHRIVNVAVVLATAVNRDGHREILGVDLVTTEDGAGWTTFLRGAGRPRPERRPARHQRRPRGPQGRDRRGPARRLLAAVPHASKP
jgi:putative transposase